MIRDHIYLRPMDLAVAPIKDYYGTARVDGILNTNIRENQLYDISIVKAVGGDLPDKLVGSTVFHTKGFGSTIEIPELGGFKVIQFDLCLVFHLPDSSKDMPDSASSSSRF